MNRNNRHKPRRHLTVEIGKKERPGMLAHLIICGSLRHTTVCGGQLERVAGGCSTGDELWGLPTERNPIRGCYRISDRQFRSRRRLSVPRHGRNGFVTHWLGWCSFSLKLLGPGSHGRAGTLALCCTRYKNRSWAVASVNTFLLSV